MNKNCTKIKSKNASYQEFREPRVLSQHPRAGKVCDSAGLFLLKRKDGELNNNTLPNSIQQASG
ncbi:hypothetical protein [Bartonella gabonensis]|uniref:hypothetical protein n=1 Tax=Bartonella gabonensis TaxID=2699889 RepID=UPI00158EC3DF|nr:hypothetical protein [Bartonella gabonensis]